MSREDEIRVYDSAREWISNHTDNPYTDTADGQHEFACFAIKHLNEWPNDDLRQTLREFKSERGM